MFLRLLKRDYGLFERGELSEKRQERLMGICLLAFAGVVWILSAADVFEKISWSRGGYDLYADIETVDGLRVGDKVYLSGVLVGSVASIQLSEGFFSEVRLHIKGGQKFPSDSLLQVQTDGLFGPKFIAIIPGIEGEYMTAGNHFAESQPSLFLPDLLETISQLIIGRMRDGAFADKLKPLLHRYEGRLPKEIEEQWRQYLAEP